MKLLIKWLCLLYFNSRKNLKGLVFYDEDFGGIKIKFEPNESEDES